MPEREITPGGAIAAARHRTFATLDPAIRDSILTGLEPTGTE